MKNKISTWSIFGGISGIFIALAGGVRYFWIYYDISQALIYIFAGVTIMALSWVYNKIVSIGNRLKEIEDRLFEFEGYVRDNLKGGE